MWKCEEKKEKKRKTCGNDCGGGTVKDKISF